MNSTTYQASPIWIDPRYYYPWRYWDWHPPVCPKCPCQHYATTTTRITVGANPSNQELSSETGE